MKTLHPIIEDDRSAWPPGTTTLEGRHHVHPDRILRPWLTLDTDLQRATGDVLEEVEVFLHPKPTNDPNDPLVRFDGFVELHCLALVELEDLGEVIQL